MRENGPDPRVDIRALLLTGAPGIGKTTVIREVARQLPEKELRGFFTQEIREGGVRRGFELTTFDGHTSVMSHIDFRSRFRVGKYGVDLSVVDEAADSQLHRDQPGRLYIIDEIGKMECFSDLFRSGILRILDSGQLLVATIALRGGGFISELKQRPDVALREVTLSNRDILPERITGWARERLAGI